MRQEPEHIVVLGETDSTNLELWRRIDRGEVLPEGFVLWAGMQTAGRGQAGTKWYGEANKNLSFSVILKPGFLPPSKLFMLNKCIALGIRAALEDLTDDSGFSIKWPNDILWQKGKIAGTLIENRIQGQTFELTVAGIGININQTVFPAAIPNPTSLALISGREYDIAECLGQVFHQLITYYRYLKEGKETLINKAYMEQLLGLGEWMHFRHQDKNIKAMICGVNEYGKLILKNEDHQYSEHGMKEVELLL